MIKLSNAFRADRGPAASFRKYCRKPGNVSARVKSSQFSYFAQARRQRAATVAIKVKEWCVQWVKCALLEVNSESAVGNFELVREATAIKYCIW
ncbi:Protein of unknown function [Gryllus bimaculatus]|nr:Protein of unknown function [Gryllus bimaculatus]